jgi:hypothetical protein
VFIIQKNHQMCTITQISVEKAAGKIGRSSYQPRTGGPFTDKFTFVEFLGREAILI